LSFEIKENLAQLKNLFVLYIINIITAIAIVQSIFLLIILIPEVKKSKSILYIVALLFVFLLDLLSYFTYNTGFIKKFPIFQGIGEMTLFLYGPIIYLYVKQIRLKNNVNNKYIILLHFLPAFIVFVFLSPFLFKDIGVSFIGSLNNLPRLFKHHGLKVALVDFLIYYSHVLIYFYMTYKLLRRDSNYKNVRNKQKHKLQRVLGIYVATGLVIILIFFIKPFVNFSSNILYQLVTAFFLFHIYGISYLIYQDKGFILRINELKKYKTKQLLSTKYRAEKLSKLLHYFQIEKPFLDKKLNISKVASNLQMTSNSLSFIINEELNKRFNDFVNEYRINLAKTYLIDSSMEYLTIEAIAHEVGFNSKSTFNSVFKKITGMTPSEFKNRKKQ